MKSNELNANHTVLYLFCMTSNFSERNQTNSKDKQESHCNFSISHSLGSYISLFALDYKSNPLNCKH